MNHRDDNSVQRCRSLIQHRAGIELPAGGTWTIGSGQPISAGPQGSRQPGIVAFHTDHGALRVPGESRVVGLELGLIAPEASTGDAGRRPRTITYTGRLVAADQSGRWRFGGIVAVDDARSELELTVLYQGVHTRGAAPVAWLTIADAVLTVGRGRLGRPRLLQLSGDLNARSADDDAVAAPPLDAPLHGRDGAQGPGFESAA